MEIVGLEPTGDCVRAVPATCYPHQKGLIRGRCLFLCGEPGSGHFAGRSQCAGDGATAAMSEVPPADPPPPFVKPPPATRREKELRLWKARGSYSLRKAGRINTSN